MNSVRSNDLRMKYQRFTTVDCKEFEFVAKTQLLYFQDFSWRKSQFKKSFFNQIFLLIE